MRRADHGYEPKIDVLPRPRYIFPMTRALPLALWILAAVPLAAGDAALPAAAGNVARDVCRVSANPLLGPPLADGVLRADRGLFDTLDKIFARFGYARFSLVDVVSALETNELRVSHHLNRALARGSLEMPENGTFAILRRAVSASGQVGREIHGMSSPLATESLANSVARLIAIRNGEELAGDFNARTYRENTPSGYTVAKQELELGRDLGLIEVRQQRDNKHRLLYRYVEGAGLPDSLAEAVASASARLAALASGTNKMDDILFEFLDEAYRRFRFQSFSSGQAASVLGLKTNSFNYYLSRAIARGSFVRVKNGTYRIHRRAVSPRGKWEGRGWG